MKKIRFIKKLSLVLAVAALVMSFMTVPVVGRVGMISADSGEELPVETDQEVPEESALVEDEKNSEPADEETAAGEIPEEEVLPEEPLEDERLTSLSFSAMTVGAIGDDPAVQDELPDFGTNYGNGDCVTNDSCETAEPVTNPNEYSDQGTYGEKDYVLPDIGGNEANIVAIKEGNDWYFFKKGSGETCVASSFCVEFDDQGNVSVYSYQTQGNGYKGYNMIHFWYAQEDTDEEVYGCTDRLALNYNPDATMDDQSCQYDEELYGCTDPLALNYNPDATADDQSCEYEEDDPGDGDEGGGGGTTTSLLIPVTAPGAGGPIEELLLIPVTGVDLASQAAGLQKGLLSASALLLGINLVLAGLEKKSKR